MERLDGGKKILQQQQPSSKEGLVVHACNLSYSKQMNPKSESSLSILVEPCLKEVK